jgi:hemoglobin
MNASDFTLPMTSSLRPACARPLLEALRVAVARPVLLIGMAFALAAGGASRSACADDTLYRQLGEKAGIDKIVVGLMARLHADPRTSEYFINAPDRRIREKLDEQICVLGGGPCTYTGRSMKRSHAGEKITMAAFNALVEDLQDSMDENDIPFRVQNKLLALFAPMYRDIVEN